MGNWKNRVNRANAKDMALHREIEYGLRQALAKRRSAQGFSEQALLELVNFLQLKVVEDALAGNDELTKMAERIILEELKTLSERIQLGITKKDVLMKVLSCDAIYKKIQTQGDAELVALLMTTPNSAAGTTIQPNDTYIKLEKKTSSEPDNIIDTDSVVDDLLAIEADINAISFDSKNNPEVDNDWDSILDVDGIFSDLAAFEAELDEGLKDTTESSPTIAPVAPRTTTLSNLASRAEKQLTDSEFEACYQMIDSDEKDRVDNVDYLTFADFERALRVVRPDNPGDLKNLTIIMSALANNPNVTPHEIADIGSNCAAILRTHADSIARSIASKTLENFEPKRPKLSRVKRFLKAMLPKKMVPAAWLENQIESDPRIAQISKSKIDCHVLATVTAEIQSTLRGAMSDECFDSFEIGASILADYAEVIHTCNDSLTRIKGSTHKCEFDSAASYSSVLAKPEQSKAAAANENFENQNNTQAEYEARWDKHDHEIESVSRIKEMLIDFQGATYDADIEADLICHVAAKPEVKRLLDNVSEHCQKAHFTTGDIQAYFESRLEKLRSIASDPMVATPNVAKFLQQHDYDCQNDIRSRRLDFSRLKLDPICAAYREQNPIMCHAQAAIVS